VAAHRLVLLRHAKSAWPAGVPDHERPLAGRGRRNAKTVGQWFATEGPRPDLVICSDAVRARHTWEIARAGLRRPPPERLEPALYGAQPADLIRMVASTTEDVGVLVLVGHEPTLSECAETLAGKGSDRHALARLAVKFPTSGIAVLRVPGKWRDLAPGRAVLEAFAVPR
jgi:phosphohistidine phosphatase